MASDETMFRKSIVTLMKEVYEGAAEPNCPTWIVSNGVDTGLFGTIQKLTPQQAAAKPKDATHSVAQHVAHMKFTLDVNLRYAQGEQPGKLDWEQSWRIPEPFTKDAWQALQRSLGASYQALCDWAETKEKYDNFLSFCGFGASVAHAAYHLGAIRQLASIVSE